MKMSEMIYSIDLARTFDMEVTIYKRQALVIAIVGEGLSRGKYIIPHRASSGTLDSLNNCRVIIVMQRIDLLKRLTKRFCSDKLMVCRRTDS